RKKVVIAETASAQALADILGSRELGPDPVRISGNLYAMTVSPEEALAEYFEVKVHLKRLARPLIASQLVEYVTHAAPGLRDILMLGKLWYLARRSVFDLIVFDTPASGHAVSMLRSPQGFLEAVPRGPLAEQTGNVVDWLTDPDAVSIHLVTTAEEMPVNETIETTALLEEHLGMDVSSVIVNMLFPEAADARTEKALNRVESSDALRSAGRGLRVADARNLYECVEFYRSQRSFQARHRRRLKSSLSGTASIAHLPYLFTGSIGGGQLESLADALEGQLL
ncbi:MAG: ArsA family ATPase, partial [Actinomycetota bacterium]